MVRIIFGVFVVLHGLVHMLYFGQSARYFELQPGLAWPDGSWVFARLLGDETTRLLASIFLVAATVGFVAGGAGILLGQAWQRPVVVSAAIFSTVIYILFWDGAWQNLHDKGAIGILINLAILVAVLIFQWPSFEF
ncbi:MAG: hypothetical protein JXM69_01880 [Anaerolineae bacterium]|nr:hypothetical protein [Anaerolineae bacterium]